MTTLSFSPIPTKSLPETLLFYQKLASKNNPAQLEPKDFEDFFVFLGKRDTEARLPALEAKFKTSFPSRFSALTSTLQESTKKLDPRLVHGELCNIALTLIMGMKAAADVLDESEVQLMRKYFRQDPQKIITSLKQGQAMSASMEEELRLQRRRAFKLDFTPVPLSEIPNAFSLYREIASTNNADLLEPEDLTDFIKAFDYSQDETFAFVFLNLSNQLLRQLQSEKSTSPRDKKSDASTSRQVLNALSQILTGGSNKYSSNVLARVEAYFGVESAERILRAVFPDTSFEDDEQSRFIDQSKKFEHDSLYIERIAQARLEFDQVMADYNERFGFKPTLPPLPQGRVFFRDLFGEEIDFNAPRATDHAVFRANKGTIEYSSERLMLEGLQSLRHELNHFWLYSAVGYAAYMNDFPKWFREGLAVVASEQLDQKRIIALFSCTDDGLEQILSPDINEINLCDYYSAGMAVQALIDYYGSETIGQIIREVQKGISFDEALEQINPQWQGEVFYQHVRNIVIDDLNSSPEKQARQDIIDLLNTYGDARYQEASLYIKIRTMTFILLEDRNPEVIKRNIDVWSDYLKKHSETGYATIAHFYLALLNMRDPQKLQENLDRLTIVSEMPRYYPFVQQAMAYRAQAAKQTTPESERLYEILYDPKAREILSMGHGE